MSLETFVVMLGFSVKHAELSDRKYCFRITAWWVKKEDNWHFLQNIKHFSKSILDIEIDKRTEH